MSRGQALARHSGLNVLKAGTLYFVFVFAAGFVLGIIRTIWIAPHFGTRNAELMEAPVMLVVIVPSARWAARRLTTPTSWARRLTVGLVALGLLLLAEFTVVLWVRGFTITQYLADRDPVSGAVYVVMLAVFALMPLLMVKRSD